MRCRAWDSVGDTLVPDSGDQVYQLVYDEFCGTYATPIDAGYGFWRTRVTDGTSQGYEIEKMESKPVSSRWLHLQRKPGVDTALNYP